MSGNADDLLKELVKDHLGSDADADRDLSTDYGWEEEAPFDNIIITAAVDHVPPALLQQLVDGGKIVLPLGHPFRYQYLVIVTKEGEDFRLQQISGVLFVPMTGKALEKYR